MPDKNEKMKLRLFLNSYKKSDKHPLMTGSGEIPKEALREFVEALKASPNNEVKVSCALWKRKSQKGKEYDFVSIELERKRNGGSDGDIPF